MAVQAYSGGCQCGAVRYDVNVDIDQLFACNCSRCGRLGLNLSFAPEDEFTLVTGSDSLTEFQFNKHVIHHMFCKVCGVQSFARGQKPDGSRMVAVNVRCLDGLNPNELNPQKIDGRSR